MSKTAGIVFICSFFLIVYLVPELIDIIVERVRHRARPARSMGKQFTCVVPEPGAGIKITAVELTTEEKESLTVPKESAEAWLKDDQTNFDNPRPLWPEIWMNIAHEVARRSYDKRLRVGCVIVPDDNTAILGLGYNGNAQGLPNEPESDEPGKTGMIHAEVNCLIKCDFSFPKKKIMYVTHSPCRQCAKLIINAGISRVVYDEMYRDASSVELLRSAGIEVLSIEEALAR